jgi:hypothetical protein
MRELMSHELNTMIPNPEKLAAFFALIAKRQAEQEARQAQERRDREDKKLAKLKPWYLESAQ